jgi:hypothetical protein
VWLSGSENIVSVALFQVATKEVKKVNRQQMNMQHRQGDVLFVRIAELPEETLVQRKSHIIVEGESTGHAHRLLQGIILESATGIYLKADQPTEVVHEEHHTIALEPGYWQVIRQREYTPEGIRQVMD